MANTATCILFSLACAVVTAGFGAPSVLAQTQTATELETRRSQSETERQRILQSLTLSEQRATEITTEIAKIRKDSASLSAALVQAAKTERKLELEVTTISGRLDELQIQQTDLRASLAERRDVLAQVLGALQRMGLNPPPAILVRPEDALSSVRSAILLAAVVPELRSETEVLFADLRELQRITSEISNEQEKLATTIREQVEEQRRLSLLVEEKRQLQAQSEEKLALEQARAVELAQEASSLSELIEALESEIEIAARSDAERQEAARKALRTPLNAGSLPFSTMKGRVALPVAGHIGRGFGEADASGSILQGDMLATHSTAIVTAPVDGSVLYAGPFRSYGQLLILNAGEGYHVVLAGMARIGVSPGQSVLAGEPVGLMGESRIASAVAFTGADAGPELYVEFRKEGKPVDPAPWWAERTTGRTGNDS